jgi:nucleoside-diphosphate-sugar epimerase
VVGKNRYSLTEGPLEDEESSSYNNEYERSKMLAERNVLERMRVDGINATIFRPSIVVGEKAKGKLVNFNGYYLGVNAWQQLKRHLTSAGKAKEVVRIEIPNGNAINLIPVDDAVNMMIEIGNTKPAPGQIFNIVNDHYTEVGLIHDVLRNQLKIQIEVVKTGSFSVRPKTRYEKLISYGMNYVSPYAFQEAVRFDASNRTRSLGAPYRYEFSFDVLHRINDAFLSKPGAVATS